MKNADKLRSEINLLQRQILALQLGLLKNLIGPGGLKIAIFDEEGNQVFAHHLGSRVDAKPYLNTIQQYLTLELSEKEKQLEECTAPTTT